MFDLLFSVFIFPLEYLMQFVMEAVLNSTGNPILSLISVSIFVSIGSLPLYHLAEKWQDNERTIQEKLKPKLKEFKSVFKGANLNAYIQTLYRQNNYHPIFAIRAVFGLLIQIPFFFAAYHLLSDYPSFDGVSAFIFDDLGRPDGIIAIGSVSINVLPFVMTAVNIVSARIYSKKLGKKEKYQIYGIAGVFLVALYTSPSSLLFYWTLNNLFNLFKNGIYRLIYPNGKIEGSIKNISKPLSAWSKVAQFKPSAWIQIVLFIFCSTIIIVGTELMKPNSDAANYCYGLSFVILFVLGAFVVAGVLADKRLTNSYRIFTSITYGIVLIISLFYFSFWFFEIKANLLNAKYASGILFTLLVFNGLRVTFIKMSAMIERNHLEISFYPKTMFSLAVLTLFSTIFIAVPLPLVSTASIGDFEKPLFFYLSFMVMLVVSFFILCSMVYAFLSKSSKSLFTYITSIAAIVCLTNAFVFAGDYGDMSNFHFDGGLPADAAAKIINILTIICIISGLIVAIAKGFFKWLLPILGICFLSIVIVSLNEGHRFHEKSKKIAHKTDTVVSLDNAFTFSKDKQNVVIIMLDRFIGGLLPTSFDLVPRLNSQFEGFSWHPKYFSDGAFTILGVPSLMGGWEYSTNKVQNTRTTMPLKQKLDESARVLPYNFTKAGFDTTVYANLEAYFNYEDKSHTEKTKFESLKGKYKDIWLKEHEKKLEENNVSGKLLMFGLFRTAPAIFREYIYDDGQWLLKTKLEQKGNGTKTVIGDEHVSFLTTNQGQINRAVDSFSTLSFLPKLSKTADNIPKQFYYFSNTFTHEPTNANANFDLSVNERIFYPREIYDEFKEDLYTLQHIYTDTAALVALGKWFEWMKQNDVYDNTRIIVVSDHGRNVHDPVLKSQKITSSKRKNKLDASWFHGLFLFKDFNQKGSLKTNNEFFTTCDIPYVAMNKIVSNPINPSTKKKISKKENKYPFHLYYTPPMIWHQTEYKYKITETYEILKNSDVLDPTKWKLSNVK